MCLSNPSTAGEELRHRKSGSVSPTSVISETSFPIQQLQEKEEVKQQKPTNVRDKNAIQKLFTSKEESHVFHVHKILGVTALISYVYRFAHLGDNDGNFGPNIGTLVFIFHHWFLNGSSFVFAIPHRRIRDGGFRIWPEYRWHSLMFATRNLAGMLLIWYEQTRQVTQPHYFMDWLIVLGTCAGADYGSYLQGDSRSNTVRGTTYSDPYGKWFASEMQFNLTALSLIGARRYTMHLVGVVIIQLNSFLMTLRRKNVASHEVLTAGYGLLLVIGFWIGVMEDDYTELMYPVGTIGSMAVILRMGPLHLNKYILWTVLWLALHVIRTYDLVHVGYNVFWLCAFVVTKFIATALGMRKRSQELKATSNDGSMVQNRMVYTAFISYAFLGAYMYYRNIYLEELWEE
ncbi:expressed unknown protein [Seminavis robusta]|uniref:Uncharacterized protein n=1 Tax=Seminavis robusta TaxID=568900 RepID=A0A9N8HP28_9STRA|nr:expressed unknown protein [Seminavis robusta]|eukprot:Sro1049_g235330.1 n/a (402) ;mRNA; r:6318-7615